MKTLKTVLIGMTLSTILATTVTPAFALGGCGPNRHRDGWGHCVGGGQNQAWCVRHTGHPAVRMPNGNLRCVR